MVALEIQSEEAGDPDPGSWAYDTVVVTTQRQSGKSFLLRPVVVHRIGPRLRGRVWSTAQTRTHARRRWLDVTDALLATPLGPDLRRTTGVGTEALKWRNGGGSLEPFAPNADSLHGETPDLVLVDELWAFDAEEARELRQAYLPATTTKDAQAWLLSTAGDGVTDWWLRLMRRRGRAAVERDERLGLCYLEHSLPDEVDGIPVEELTDEELVEACIRYHPSRGFNLREQSLRSAWRELVDEADDVALARAEYLRGYGNRTPSTRGSTVIPRDAWREARTSEELPEGRVAFGVEVDPEGRETSIVAAAAGAGGERVVEVVERRDGSTWAVERLVELVGKWETAAVGFVNAAASRELADAVEARFVDLELEVPIARVAWTDYASASVRFDREVRDGTIRHRGQADLDTALSAASRKRIGAAWGFVGPRDPVTALVGATIAPWTLDHAPAPEPEGSFWIG